MSLLFRPYLSSTYLIVQTVRGSSSRYDGMLVYISKFLSTITVCSRMERRKKEPRVFLFGRAVAPPPRCKRRKRFITRKTRHRQGVLYIYKLLGFLDQLVVVVVALWKFPADVGSVCESRDCKYNNIVLFCILLANYAHGMSSETKRS